MAVNSNYLPPLVGIAISKAQFCFCTGCTPYNLRKIIALNYDRLVKLGYHTYDKLLMPSVTLELLALTKLQIDLDLFVQYVQRARRA